MQAAICHRRPHAGRLRLSARLTARYTKGARVQVVVAMKRGRREGKTMQAAAARGALWLLNDLPAHVEALAFPSHAHEQVRKQACLRVVCSMDTAGTQLLHLPVIRYRRLPSACHSVWQSSSSLKLAASAPSVQMQHLASH